MSVGPITYLEIDAFDRRTLAGLTAWETKLIRRLDDAVIAVVTSTILKPKSAADAATTAIPVANVSGVRALFQGLAARKDAEIAAKANAAQPQRRERRIIPPTQT